jgi:hypothetical protein
MKNEKKVYLQKAGVYSVEIYSCKKTKTFNTKQDALLLELKTADGKFLEYLVLLEGKGAYYFRKLLEAVDSDVPENEITSEYLIGREFIANVRRRYSSNNEYHSWLQITETYSMLDVYRPERGIDNSSTQK